ERQESAGRGLPQIMRRRGYDSYVRGARFPAKEARCTFFQQEVQRALHVRRQLMDGFQKHRAAGCELESVREQRLVRVELGAADEDERTRTPGRIMHSTRDRFL